MGPEERRRHLAKLDPFSKKRSAAAYLGAYLDDDTDMPLWKVMSLWVTTAQFL